MSESYFISTDKTLLNIPWIHEYLANESYWAQGRNLNTVELSIRNSLCFGVYQRANTCNDIEQCGFARVVTDYATFAWLCDVFISPSHRGISLGKKLIDAVFSHDEIAQLTLSILATKDAHGLYRDSAGFQPLNDVHKWMSRSRS